MYDGIEFRGFQQATVDELAAHAGVPVWNGLTDLYHPTQGLADLMTLEEMIPKPLSRMKLAYIGDARNNMGNSLLIACAKMGIDFTAVAPRELFPEDALVEEMRKLGESTGSRIETQRGYSPGGCRSRRGLYRRLGLDGGGVAVRRTDRTSETLPGYH